MIRFLLLLFFSFSVSAATYYVDPTNGSDSYTGLAGAFTTGTTGPWKTVAKVKSTVSGTSDDVYFIAGSNYYEQLVVDWVGVLGDRSTVGSYYMSGGSPVIGVPDGVNRPTFWGNYAKAGDPYNVANAIPPTQYAGLVQVIVDYVTVQDIAVKNSAGIGINLLSTVASPHHYMTVDNVVVDYTAGSSVVFNRGSTYGILRNSDISWCAQSNANGDDPPPHPLCIGLTTSNYGIIENNYVHEHYGEGITTWEGSRGAIIRNNVIAGVRSANIYMDNAYETIVEGNIMSGGMTVTNRDGFSWQSSAGITIGVEDYGNLHNAVNNVIRNNLMAGSSGACIAASMEINARNAGGQIDGKFFNNVCGNARGIWISAPTANTGIIEIKNNIFFGQTIQSICNTTDIDADYNIWETQQTVNACTGTNDIISAPGLNRTDWTGISMANQPTLSDFNLATGSAAINAGIAQTVTEYTTEFPQASSLQAGCALDLTESSKDFFDIDTATGCNTRANPPDIGAFEEGTLPAPSGDVTVPYYENTGADGQLVLSKTYLASASCTGTSTGTETAAIANTTDDAVYQSYRQSGNAQGVVCATNIANGDYDVTLLLNEHYYGDNAGTCTFSGSDRKFNVVIEGVTKSANYDICQDSGAANTAVRKTYGSITVSDGILNINLTPGTGADTKPVISGFEVVTAVPTGSTLTVNNTAPSLLLNNIHPNSNAINPAQICSISTTSANPIFISSIVTTGLTSGTAIIGDGAASIEYTPANATTFGDVGDIVVNVSDSEDTGQCTITVTLRGEKKIEFDVFDTTGAKLASTTGWGWCWTPYGSSLITSAIVCSSNDDETTDANGRMVIYDSRLPEPGSGIRVNYFLFNVNSVTGADGARLNRPISGTVKVTR